jgi:hypothetical protein
MNRYRFAAIAVIVGLMLAGPMGSAARASGNQAFGFNSPLVTGFPGDREVEVTGGGAYDLPGFVKSGGGFRCLTDITDGKLKGCLAGQGIRWDTSALLASTTFKCTGAATEALKTAVTNDKTIVILADFYRQGDGNDESFTAQMIVSAEDLDPLAEGIQNVWIQQVGCGSATVNFN